MKVKVCPDDRSVVLPSERGGDEIEVDEMEWEEYLATMARFFELSDKYDDLWVEAAYGDKK